MMNGKQEKSSLPAHRAEVGAPHEDPFIRAVEAIYATALVPEKWPEALQAISDVFDDVGTALTYRRSDGRLGVIVSPGLVAGQEDYNREWHRHDVRAQRFLERSYLAADTMTDLELGLLEEQDTHPFFTQFLKSYGLRHFAAVSIAPDSDIYATISVQRAIGKDPFSEGERNTLVRLGRHAESSLRLGLRLMESESRSQGLSDLFARLRMGIYLLDGLGRVVFANDTGKSFIGGTLALANDGRLTARDRGHGAALEAAISATLQNRPSADAYPRPILLRSEGAAPILAAYVLPLNTALSPAIEQFLVRSQAIVLIVELRTGDSADPSVVRDLLGLTLGEARVAALIAAGVSPRDASLKLGISAETTRTVLKRVYMKSGVSRQSELAALIARSAINRPLAS